MAPSSTCFWVGFSQPYYVTSTEPVWVILAAENKSLMRVYKLVWTTTKFICIRGANISSSTSSLQHLPNLIHVLHFWVLLHVLHFLGSSRWQFGFLFISLEPPKLNPFANSVLQYIELMLSVSKADNFIKNSSIQSEVKIEVFYGIRPEIKML